ncbi:uncharacterized protein LOC129870388 [Solanum dulcamara]|uniref:uncharacterized protein LOC129870388 n=1 Tax=Solanum dulcamara TaxID=45834 RepID=UPI0024851336|nr:uncharacterized protein LOC129870388 [Solanum dulcamara]
MENNMSRKKRVRVDSDDSEYNSPEVKKLRENLLEDLTDDEFCTTSHDFDSFMKSFEEEITASPAKATETEIVDLTVDSDESQPELGYLLEASDDELGLPPPAAKAVESETEIELMGSELWEVEERIPNYDSFELGMADLVDYEDSVCEYVALDGLFDHSDLGFGSPDFLWRPETLPAN